MHQKISLNILIKWKTSGKADQLKEGIQCMRIARWMGRKTCMRVQRRVCLWIRVSFYKLEPLTKKSDISQKQYLLI